MIKEYWVIAPKSMDAVAVARSINSLSRKAEGVNILYPSKEDFRAVLLPGRENEVRETAKVFTVTITEVGGGEVIFD